MLDTKSADFQQKKATPRIYKPTVSVLTGFPSRMGGSTTGNDAQLGTKFKF